MDWKVNRPTWCLNTLRKEEILPLGRPELGKQLAGYTRSKNLFGDGVWTTVGATPQPNPRSDDWVSFYRDHHLAHQFELAAHKGRKFEGSQTLLDSLHSFFPITLPTHLCSMEICGRAI